MIEKVERFKTSDGKLFDTMSRAEEHEVYLASLERANAILSGGGSMYDALSEVRKGPYDDVLKLVTKDTKLIISHWQCNDDPVYQAGFIDERGSIWVAGNGGWSGHYGNYVTASDLARYALKTLEHAQ